MTTKRAFWQIGVTVIGTVAAFIVMRALRGTDMARAME